MVDQYKYVKVLPPYQSPLVGLYMIHNLINYNQKLQATPRDATRRGSTRMNTFPNLDSSLRTGHDAAVSSPTHHHACYDSPPRRHPSSLEVKHTVCSHTNGWGRDQGLCCVGPDQVPLGGTLRAWGVVGKAWDPDEVGPGRHRHDGAMISDACIMYTSSNSHRAAYAYETSAEA